MLILIFLDFINYSIFVVVMTFLTSNFRQFVVVIMPLIFFVAI